MATEIIKEINSYNSKYNLKIGFLFCLCTLLIFFLSNNIKNKDSIPFIAKFNYVEGINNKSEIQIAGIKIGEVKKITITSEGVTINGQIDKKYNIPEDSISEGKLYLLKLDLENISISLKTSIYSIKLKTLIQSICF